MSQKSDTTLPQTVEIILPTAIVDVAVGAAFFSRLQELTHFLLEGKSRAEIQAAHELIQTDKVTDGWVKHYETMLILNKELEENYRKAGLTEMRDLASL